MWKTLQWKLLRYWTEGLSQYGSYYTGIAEEDKLHKIFKFYKRGAVIFFGTQSQTVVNKPKLKSSDVDNDDDINTENHNIFTGIQ